MHHRCTHAGDAAHGSAPSSAGARCPDDCSTARTIRRLRNVSISYFWSPMAAAATPFIASVTRGPVYLRDRRARCASLFGRWWSSAFRLTTPIFVARGPALLFGISRWLSQHGISRKRRNNLTRVLIAVERSTSESKANSSHPSSREGHRCAGLSLRQFGVRRSDCRRHFPCPAELGSITPHAAARLPATSVRILRPRTGRPNPRAGRPRSRPQSVEGLKPGVSARCTPAQT